LENLADFIGVPLDLVNIGGRSVKDKVMKQVDESFFKEVVKEGVHMSMCVKYRQYSYKSPEAQMFAVHNSLHRTCTAINRPENHQRMIDEPHIEMAVARDSFQDYAWAYGLLSSGEEPSANELNANPALAKIWKQATEVSRPYQRRRVDKLRKENEDPSLDDFANPIFCELWERDTQLRKVKEMIKKSKEPNDNDLANEVFCEIWERERQLPRAKHFLDTDTQPTLEDFANPIFWKHYLNESQLRRAKYFLGNNTEPTLEDFTNPVFCKHWEREKRLRGVKVKRDRFRQMIADGVQPSPPQMQLPPLHMQS
jgi:hypothetical protein